MQVKFSWLSSVNQHHSGSVHKYYTQANLKLRRKLVAAPHRLLRCIKAVSPLTSGKTWPSTGVKTFKFIYTEVLLGITSLFLISRNKAGFWFIGIGAVTRKILGQSIIKNVSNNISRDLAEIFSYTSSKIMALNAPFTP